MGRYANPYANLLDEADLLEGVVAKFEAGTLYGSKRLSDGRNVFGVRTD